MADRILVWTPTTHDAAFYLERDYSPDALRIHATVAPTLGDLVVDILDDGVSIMQGGSVTVDKMTKADGEIRYGTHSGTFQEREIVTGDTSSATGEVLKVSPGCLSIWHTSPGTQFVVGETIDGATSAASATVDAWVAPQEYYTPVSTPRTSNARLEQGETLNDEAEDFGRERPLLQEGSIVTMSKLEMGGANGITVQLELSAID